LIMSSATLTVTTAPEAFDMSKLRTLACDTLKAGGRQRF